MAVGYTRGVVFVHSAPRALCPHVQWMLEDVLKTEVHLEWGVQKATPGVLRTEYSWVGPIGTGALLASAMRGWANLRYEIKIGRAHV